MKSSYCACRSPALAVSIRQVRFFNVLARDDYAILKGVITHYSATGGFASCDCGFARRTRRNYLCDHHRDTIEIDEISYSPMVRSRSVLIIKLRGCVRELPVSFSSIGLSPFSLFCGLSQE